LFRKNDISLPLHLFIIIQKEPTPIQKQAVPASLSGRDILATADTGSGKTLAYLIPLATFLNTQPPSIAGQGPLAIIVAPTRELVQQIYIEAHRLLAPWHIFSMLLQYPSQASASRLGMDNTNSVHAAQSSSHLQMQADGTQWDSSGYSQGVYQQPMGPGAPIHPLVSSTGPVAGRKVLGVVGGLSVNGQMATLRTGVDVLIATPGRLLDLLGRHAFSLDRLRYLVFDEIDRMLELRVKESQQEGESEAQHSQQTQRQNSSLGSMEDQLRRFVAQCSFNERQTLLFSATMPQGVIRLARSAVLDPVIIKIGSSRRQEASTSTDGSGNSSIPRNIKQHVIFVQSSAKNQKLLDVLRKTPSPPVIIFCGHITTVDKIVDVLRAEQFHVAGLHSEKPQEYRFKVVETMRRGRLDVLVATDIASRGLDFQDITHVIQYDLPETIEDYIHRVGRTGRAGREGHATALLTYHCKIAGHLRQLLKESDAQLPPELEKSVHMFGHKVVQTEFGDKVIFE
jgi:superfamily II DNA/RNA helicase